MNEASPQNVAELSARIDRVTSVKIQEIKSITLETRLLSLNAAIEAAHVGEAGRSFAVVAGRVREVSDRVETLADSLQQESRDVGGSMQQALRRSRGQRLADMALNVIETIDRNLYERTCDVRWWATEAAVQALAADPGDQDLAVQTRQRLGVILGAYTVYLDIWVVDPSGRVLCNGRADTYPDAQGHNVSGQTWFKQALAGRGLDAYATGDVQPVAALGGGPQRHLRGGHPCRCRVPRHAARRAGRVLRLGQAGLGGGQRHPRVRRRGQVGALHGGRCAPARDRRQQ